MSDLEKEWQKSVEKVLRGNPLSSLQKTYLSGIVSKVVYTEQGEFSSIPMRTGKWDVLYIGGDSTLRYHAKSSILKENGLKNGLWRIQGDGSVPNGLPPETRIERIGLPSSEVQKFILERWVLQRDEFAESLLRSCSLEKSVVQMLVNQSGSHPVTIDATIVHGLGGTGREELLWVLLVGAQLQRWGMLSDWGRVWAQLSVDATIFDNVVKLRALRRLCAGFAHELRWSNSQPYIATETSLKMCTIADPHSNLLRTSLAAVGAVWGGADGIAIHPFDALTGGSELGERMAENIHRILAEESMLQNWDDPMSGSYQIEAQTSELCELVWADFCRIEAQGGIVSFLESGHFLQRLEGLQTQKQRQVSTRKSPIVGVTQFPNVSERLNASWLLHNPQGFPRDAEIMERLRMKVEDSNLVKPVHIVLLGDITRYKPRLEFVQQWIATIGVIAIEVPLEDVQDLDGSLVFVVGTQEMYAENLSSTLVRLQTSGAGKLIVAGQQTFAVEQKDFEWIQMNSPLIEFWTKHMSFLVEEDMEQNPELQVKMEREK